MGGIGVIIGTDVERFSAEVGYWLGEPFWGRGIVTEALNLFSQDVFERLNLLRLFAVASAANVGSARVLEKAGYQQEGVMRSAAVKFGVPNDQLLFARINPHWRGPTGEQCQARQLPSSNSQGTPNSQLPSKTPNSTWKLAFGPWFGSWRLGVPWDLEVGGWKLT